MNITRENYSSYANLVQQLGGGKLNPVDKYGTDYGNFALRFTPTDRPFVKPNWDAINTEAEFARARQFTAIYNDELKRLSNEYGEKAKGNISYKQIMSDIESSGASPKVDSPSGGTIDITV